MLDVTDPASDSTIASWTWEQAFAFARQHLALVVGASVAMAAVRVLGSLAASGGHVVVIVTTLLEPFVQLAILTPVAVAMHRFCLLAEARSAHDQASRGRLVRFFVLAAGWNVALQIPAVLAQVAAGLGPLSLLVWLAAFVLMAYLCLATLTAFPAIAVDAPLEAWRVAIRNGRTHVRQTLAVMFFTAVPLIILGVVLAVTFMMIGVSSAPLRHVFIALSAPLQVIGAAAFAGAASRLYLLRDCPAVAPS